MDPTDAMVMGLTSFKVALVFHIAGALVLFGAVGMQALAVGLLHSAKSVDRVRLVIVLVRRLAAIFAAASAMVLASGLYLGYLNWHYGETVGWVIVALVAFVLTGIHGAIASRRLGIKLESELALAKGRFTPGLQKLAKRRRPIAELCASAGSIIGILVVMIFQPSVSASALIIVNGTVYGLIFSLIPLSNSKVSDKVSVD